MIEALEATHLTKRYGKVSALRDCNLALPKGRVVGLVGPNGAGKTTLMHLAVGLLAPTSGAVQVFGHSPQVEPTRVLARVGFVAQDRPLYDSFTAGEMLEFGRQLNGRWDAPWATARISRLRIPLDRPVRNLSTGQRAQIALTLALGKRPDFIILDEPVVNLDPLARSEFLQGLMTAVAENGSTVLMSSHVIADLERVCDYLVILAAGGVQIAGDIETLLSHHAFVVGPHREETAADPSTIEVVQTERQTLRLVRTAQPEAPHTLADGTSIRPPTLDELVLAYLRMPQIDEAA